MSEIFVNEREAATRLGLAPATLSRWRWAGKGPASRKFGGAVRYAVSDLDRFAENPGGQS
ncbi:helix-turn-helix domain-containing protein [Sphingobium sp. ba1]|uniref:helix-turn-helix domain-containing protein n=1 Tax=Sphingobium sp. ba1 TaxID=1522072 RepID=UPI00097154F3